MSKKKFKIILCGCITALCLLLTSCGSLQISQGSGNQDTDRVNQTTTETTFASTGNWQKKWMRRASSFPLRTPLTSDVWYLRFVNYVYAYAQLLKDGKITEGEKINVVVPTGNFGNILAAFYAKNMGLPIDKLICASNDNKVLYDFFRTGTYDRNREFVLTTSPSMDILISSNLERLIYRIAGNDADKNRELMSALSGNGKYEITEEMKAQLADFYGNFASEAETAAEIRRLYEKCGYVIDTHTAVASAVYGKYVVETGDHKTTVIASTASPFKFTRSVMDAIDIKYDAMGDFELVDELSKIAKVKVPNAIEEIRTAPVLHDTQCDVDKIERHGEVVFLECS